MLLVDFATVSSFDDFFHVIDCERRRGRRGSGSIQSIFSTMGELLARGYKSHSGMGQHAISCLTSSHWHRTHVWPEAANQKGG